MLAKVFLWHEGTFAFDDEPETEAGQELTLKLSTGELILEAVQAVRDPDVVRVLARRHGPGAGALERPPAALPEADPVSRGRLRALAGGRDDERPRDRADDPAAGRANGAEPPRPPLDRCRRVRGRAPLAKTRRPARAKPPPAAKAPPLHPPHSPSGSSSPSRSLCVSPCRSRSPSPAATARRGPDRGRRRREGRRAAARDPRGVGGPQDPNPLRGPRSLALRRRSRGEGRVLPPGEALPPGRAPRRLARGPARRARGGVHPPGRGVRRAARHAEAQ